MSENTELNSDIKNKKDFDQEILSIPPENSNNHQNGKTLCDFIIKEKIGEGTFSTVKVAINLQTNEKVAIKIMQKSKIILDEDKTRLEREIQVLKILRHPNLVHLYSVIEKDDKIYLIMEYNNGIELFDYIVKKKKLQEKEAFIFYQQIISGIEYLHKVKYIHRDIKPENILIKPDTKKLIIVDFGLSNKFNNPKKNLFKSACGSPSYAAPEMLNGEKYRGPPVDIWSSGVVLYAMLCGYLPFEDENNNNDELYDKICKGKFDIPNHVSEKAKDLINKILVTDPDKRLTISQIKKHPWFNLYNNDNKNKISEGLDLSKYIIPIDEEIVKIISKKFNINEEEIRIAILSNKHNDVSTLYYLFLKKKINNNKKSVADYKSDLFKKYCQNDNNLLKNYNQDLNEVISQRKNGEILQNQTKNIKKDRKLSFSETKRKNENINNSEDKYKKLDIKKIKNDKNKLEENHKNYSDDKRYKKFKFQRYKTPNKDLNHINDNLNIKKINNSTITKYYNFSDSIHKIIKDKVSMKIIYEETKINSFSKKEHQYKNKLTQRKKLKLCSYLTRKNINSIKLKRNENMNMNINRTEHIRTEESIKPLTSINKEQFYMYEPFDLNCVFIQPRKILKEEMIFLLDKNKIKYRVINNTKCIIELKKEDISVSISFEKLKSIDDDQENIEENKKINVIKMKRLGGYSKNLSSFEKIIYKFNYNIMNK